MVTIDDYVSRNSYNNDIVFKIVSIKDSKVILKGKDVRLIADSEVSDLRKVELLNNFL